MSSISKWEIIAYHSIALILNLYFYIEGFYLSKFFVSLYSTDGYLVEGLSWVGNLRDAIDSEWWHWKTFIIQDWPWVFLHILLVCLFRARDVTLVPVVHVAVFIVYYSSVISVAVCALSLAEAFIFYLLINVTRSKLFIWTCGVLVLLLNSQVSSFLAYEDYAAFIIDVSLAWLLLKLVDFSLRRVEDADPQSNFVDMLGYAFYLPTYHFGPFIPYSDFAPYLYRPLNINVNSVSSLVALWVKYAIYGMGVEFLYHYVYLHYLTLHSAFISSQSLWGLYGIAFCLAQIFYIKYLISYGSLGALACFEGYNAPPPPKCVTRIHLYSNMWRYFDKGYYAFMSRNIYKPILEFLSKPTLKDKKEKNLAQGDNNPSLKPMETRGLLMKKLTASTLCFLFVFVWHTMSNAVFFWSLLNFIGLSIEAIARSMFRGKKYGARLTAFVQAPMWMLAMISNTFFFGGYQFGMICLTSVFQKGFLFISVSWAVGYIMCHLANYWPISDV